MSDLFGDDDDIPGEELKINKGYATNYNNWRQKEELNKLKTKYGEHLSELNSDDDESTSSSEDEDANCLTDKYEEGFFNALSHLEKKDPKIYDDNVDFFANVRNADESDPDNAEKSQKKMKQEKNQPLYLRNYESKIILERNGKFSDSEDEEIERKQKQKEIITVPYVEEQRQILESIKQESKGIDDDNEIFKVKSKSKSDMKDELDEELSDNESIKKGNKKQKTFKLCENIWEDPKLSTDEKFLRDYVFNNKFLDKESEAANDFDNNVDDDIFSEDEKHIEENQEFEHKYNYRFEEPDQDFIKRYPRTMEDSLRKKDTRRSQKRAEVKKRKEEEKLRQKEELKQLKALKRKEIMDKIAQLKEITGNDDMKLDTIDLDGDFDPAEHDRKMQELFNEEYYNTNEDIKPEFPELDEELEIETTWDTYDPSTEEIATVPNDINQVPHCEDADFNMDADYDPNKSLKNELIGTSKKKRRRRSKFSEVIAKEKPKFDPKIHPSFKDYIDQYYALDYEDMIGDLPCRFKYRSVVPNDYGLSVEEILMADDKELNKWCSLKRALEHKAEEKELNEVRVYKQKARNEEYKKKILQSLYKPEDETNNEVNSPTAIVQTKEEQAVVEDENKKKRKRKKKKTKVTVSQEMEPEGNEQMSKIEKQDKKAESSVKPIIDKTGKKLKRPATNSDDVELTDEKTDVEFSQIQSKRQKLIEPKEETIKTANEITEQSTKIISKKLQRKAKFLQRQRKSDIKNQKEHNTVASISDERLKAYKINPRKFKNKLKYGKQKN